MSKKPYKHALGKINFLEATNYATWKQECKRILEAVMAWTIVIGEEEEPNNPVGVGIASRCSGVARRWKRHHSNGDDNAVESNGIATAVARGSWQRRLGILS